MPPQNTFYLQLPTGVSFSAAPTATPSAGSGMALSPVSLSDTDGDGKDDRATWAITAVSTSAAATITISGITYDVASTVPEGDINVTIGSEPPGNPGLTEGTVANAYATTASLIVNASPKRNVKIGATGTSAQSTGNIILTESVTGAFAAGKTITLTLPSGVEWNSNANGTSGEGPGTDEGNFAAAAANGSTWTVTSVTSSTVTITCNTASTTGPAQYKLSGIKVDVASTVSEGDINVTVGGTAGFTGTVAIASAKNPGVTASALLSTVPKVSQGSLNVLISGIKIVENFANDIDITDATGWDIRVTLPDGVTFSENLGAGNPFTVTTGNLSINQNALETDTTGYGFFTIDVTAPSGIKSALTLDGVTLNKFKVNIGSDVPVGDLNATVEVNISTTPVTTVTKTVKLAEVVAAGATVERVSTAEPPTVGTGSTYPATGNELQIKISENSIGSIPVGSAITVSITGATFNSANKPTAAATGGLAATSPATLSDGDTIATFTTTGASTTTPDTITIDLNSIKVGSTEGDITVKVTVLGAETDLVMAKAAYATKASVSEVTSLTAGAVSQEAGDIIITEKFAGALTAGYFRLVLPAGVSFATAPTVKTSPTASTLTIGTKNLGNTFHANDTAEIQITAASTTNATTITISNILYNVEPGTADGPVTVQLVDKNLKSAGPCGVTPASLVNAYVGAIPSLTPSPDSVEVAPEGTASVTVSGGIPPYSVESSDETVATATISDGTITITGVAEGSCSVTVSDSSTPAQTADISVTVTPAVVEYPTLDLRIDPLMGTPGAAYHFTDNITDPNGAAHITVDTIQTGTEAVDLYVKCTYPDGQSAWLYFDADGLVRFHDAPAAQYSDMTFDELTDYALIHGAWWFDNSKKAEWNLPIGTYTWEITVVKAGGSIDVPEDIVQTDSATLTLE